MYTQCSNCATLFQVSTRHLRQARGLARCGMCDEVFDATAGLLEALPAGLEAGEPASGTEGGAHGEASVAAPASSGDDYFTTLPSVEAPETDMPALPAKPPRMRFGFIGASGALALLLCTAVVSYAYAMRMELAQYPRLRPWIESLCLVARCQLPLLQDVARVQVLRKDAGMSPDFPDQLLVHAMIANDAAFWQPYPHIRLRFLDSAGSMRTSRWFAPEDYLAAARVHEMHAGMPPREPVLVRLSASGIGVAAQDNFIMDLR
jgi:predicted Zn finger-like uncharacterized protein